MEKIIELAIEKLQQADINGFINEKSKIDFHHGFLAGARSIIHFIQEGKTPDEALAICERHHFSSIVGGAVDD